MAASKNRIDWALLILRIGVGGLAVLQGFGPIRHARGAVTLGNALHLGAALGEIICGAMILIGVWMLPAVMVLLALIGWPLVQGWAHGASALGQPNALFRVLATLAAGLGGAGKWGIGKG